MTENSKRQKLVVVLGMHRSGTSAITRSLQVVGVNLGDNLMPPAIGNNDKGFWEDMDINQLNISIMEFLQRDWDSLAPLTNSEVVSLFKSHYISDAISLLKNKIDKHEIFGIKNPRMTVLLPFWQHVFEELCNDVHYIIPIRNPVSVACSLKNRDDFPEEKSYWLWLSHVVASVYYTQKSKRIIIDYDQFLNNPNINIEKIANFLKLPINQKELDNFLLNFIDESLRHTQYSLEQLHSSPHVPKLIQSVFPILLGQTVNSGNHLKDDNFNEIVSDWKQQLDQTKATFQLLDQLSRQLSEKNSQLKKTNTLLETFTIKAETEDSINKEKLTTIANLEKKVSNHQETINMKNKIITNLNTKTIEYRKKTMSLLNEIEQRKLDITEINLIIDKQKGDITNLNAAIVEKEQHIANLNAMLAEKEKHLENSINTINEIMISTCWRITLPLRIIGNKIKKIKQANSVLILLLKKHGITTLLKKGGAIFVNEGFRGIKHRLFTQQITAQATDATVFDYNEWVRRYDSLDDDKRKKIQKKVASLQSAPLISIVMPVYNAPIQWLAEAIQSIQKQLYSNWELCIADDHSTDPTLKPLLTELSQNDSRIKVIFREKNGHISAASNSALSLATGEWIALMDQDDLLPEHALYYVAQSILNNPAINIIYTDEDKINEHGERFSPHFKSGWNPDLFFSQNYISHFGVYRHEIIKKINGFRIGLEGAQDQDLLLRCLPYTTHDQIIHIPHVLYHWRAIEGSTALSPTQKSYTTDAGIQALEDYFTSQQLPVKIEKGFWDNTYRVKYPIPKPEPLVSLLIPTRDGLELIKTCINSIIEKTTYTNYEILILDNGSVEEKTKNYFTEIQNINPLVKVIEYNHPFNYSAINNFGVQQAKGEIIGLINNDIEVISPEWLEEMVCHAARPDIGCVGAKLYYPNNTIQHAGVILGIGGVAGHSHKYFPAEHPGYYSKLSLIQNISAVTAAALLVRKDIYQEVGGLDETNLTVAFNDVDFCLKVKTAGYRNLWTPYAELYHHESISRGAEDTPEKISRFQKEVSFMKNKWGKTLKNDPLYNPNLTIVHENFSIAWPPRISFSY